MRVARLFGGLLALAMMAAVSGCGGSGNTVKVQGKVTLDGAPLEGAGVTFIPEDPKIQVASGVTGSDGTFRLTTYNFGDGALPGDYRVTITKTEAQGAGGEKMSAPADPKAAAKDIYVKAMKQGKAKGREKTKNLVHANYGDRVKTPLKCRVPHDGPVVFELTSAGN